MKPLFLRTNKLCCTGRSIGALGLCLIALSAYGETTSLPDEAGALGNTELANIDKGTGEVPAQLVTKIEVQPEGNQVTVMVIGDGRLFPDAKLLDESRLVIDFPAVTSALRNSVVRGNHQLLRRIRVGHHVDKMRLVFDVLEHPGFSVHQKGNAVLVTLKSNEHRVALPNVEQPGSSEESPSVGSQPDKAISEPTGRAAQRAIRVIGRAQSRFRIQPAQMAAEGASPEKDSRPDDVVTGETRFVGRRISLDFQQADITNILRLIAEVSGFNIVVGEGVKSKVTMRIVSVPWDQALDMLLKMNGLGMIRQGNIVWVDSLVNISKQQNDEAAAKESKIKAEPLADRVFYVRHIPAQELQVALRQYVSARGVIQKSDGSNALIVRDTESKLETIRQLVQALDIEVPQVAIEARIVQADTVYARGLGIQWGFKDSNFTQDSFKMIGNVTGPFANAAGTGNTTIPRDFLVNLPAQVGGLPAVPSVGWTFGKLADGFALDMRLSAGELLGLTKVIAAPKITTLDKREAKISQGESIPFQTTSLQGTQTTFVDANLELNVTPQITSRDPNDVGRRIMLRVRATRNAVGARSNPAGPSIDRREANTQVLVRDGETMVIGGVFVDTQNNNVQGVPYLSRMPVFGWLFKNKSESVAKQELLIFLTPSIVKA